MTQRGRKEAMSVDLASSYLDVFSQLTKSLELPFYTLLPTTLLTAPVFRVLLQKIVSAALLTGRQIEEICQKPSLFIWRSHSYLKVAGFVSEQFITWGTSGKVEARWIDPNICSSQQPVLQPTHTHTIWVTH